MIRNLARRQFWKSAKQSKGSEVANLAKDPKMFAEWQKMHEKEAELTKDQQEYQDQLARYKRVAESKKNMAVDMRPSVLVKAMSYELIFFAFGLTMIFGLPFYFYKILPMQLQYQDQVEKEQLKMQIDEDQRVEQASRSQAISLRKEVGISTQLKSQRLTEDEMKSEIAKAEQEYERQVIKQKRQERQERIERRKAREQRKQQQSQQQS